MSEDEMIGRVFGRLTVLRRSVEKCPSGKTKYVCRCSCVAGNIVKVSRNCLISGKTKSCGCIRKEAAAERSRKDLTGMIFGRLAAIEVSLKKSKCSRLIWVCNCSCEESTTVHVSAASLLSGKTKSCGCLNEELSSYRMKEYHAARNSLQAA